MKYSMRTEILLPTVVEISHIKMDLAVRYDEEDMPNDYPFRKGDIWSITVEVDTGKIVGWPEGVEPRELYMKVCDEGSYTLLTPTGTNIAQRKDDYVPHCMVPGTYGDYIDFNIDANGVITNWPKNPTIEDFFISLLDGDYRLQNQEYEKGMRLAEQELEEMDGINEINLEDDD